MFKLVMIAMLMTVCLGQTLKAETELQKFWQQVNTQIRDLSKREGKEVKAEDLEQLDLRNISEIPANIGQLKNLTKLRLLECNQLPKEFWELENIEVLIVGGSNTPFKEKIPDEIMNFRKLNKLGLSVMSLQKESMLDISKNMKKFVFLLGVMDELTYDSFIRFPEFNHIIKNKNNYEKILEAALELYDPEAYAKWRAKADAIQNILPQPIHEEIVPELFHESEINFDVDKYHPTDRVPRRVQELIKQIMTNPDNVRIEQ